MEQKEQSAAGQPLPQEQQEAGGADVAAPAAALPALTPAEEDRGAAVDVPAPGTADAALQQPQPQASAAASGASEEFSSASIIEEEGLEAHVDDGEEDEGATASALSGQLQHAAPPTPTSGPVPAPGAAAPPAGGKEEEAEEGGEGDATSQAAASTPGSPLQLQVGDAFALSESALSEGSPQQQQQQQQQGEPAEAPLQGSHAAEGRPDTGTGQVPSEGGSRSSKSSSGKEASDYSMSFDGIDEEIEVDAAAATSRYQPPPPPSSTEIAEQITQDTMRRVFNDSVEVRASVFASAQRSMCVQVYLQGKSHACTNMRQHRHAHTYTHACTFKDALMCLGSRPPGWECMGGGARGACAGVLGAWQTWQEGGLFWWWDGHICGHWLLRMPRICTHRGSCLHLCCRTMDVG